MHATKTVTAPAPITVGTGVTRLGWTDRDPYEVTAIHTPRKLTVRAMHAERDPSWKPDFRPGGFCGTVVNQGSQRWTLTSDPKAEPVMIRLHTDGRWYDARHNRYSVGRATKFYDFNF